MKQSDVDRVLSVARSWVGYNFRAGETAQCANFVRSVFKEANVPVGSAKHPSDEKLLGGAPVGPTYADSFAGDDVGAKVKLADIAPGDIVMYKNTYGNFAPGVITHVAIYEGNGQIIHRPTSAKPVRRDNYKYMDIAEVRRIRSEASVLDISINEGRLLGCYLDGRSYNDMKFKLFLDGEKFGLASNDKPVNSVKDFSLFIKSGSDLVYHSQKEHTENGNPVLGSTIILAIANGSPKLTIDGKAIAGATLHLVLRYS